MTVTQGHNLAVEMFVKDLLRHPQRMPSVPDGVTATDVDARARDGHGCLRCPDTASTAFPATLYGIWPDDAVERRWVDLCAPCAAWFNAYPWAWRRV